MADIEATWDFRDPYVWMQKTARSALPPLIITAAISGGGHGKESNPALPETPEEQAEEARRAYEAGASQIHVHVRDPQDWSQCTGNPVVRVGPPPVLLLMIASGHRSRIIRFTRP